MGGPKTAKISLKRLTYLLTLWSPRLLIHITIMCIRACFASLVFFVIMRSFSNVLDLTDRFLGKFYADIRGVFFSQSFFHGKVMLL